MTDAPKIPNIFTPESVWAADKALAELKDTPVALDAAIAKLIEQGNAEFCKTFAWSDGEEHKFGNGEYDLHDVIVIKVQSYV